MTIDYKMGDCREVLANGFEDDSFDACVTDPPYGLEFMGKEWDRLHADEHFWKGDFDGTGFKQLPQFTGSANYRCRICGHYKLSGTPCECENPDWEATSLWKNREMQNWHYLWAKEVYRVLKPGGYLLAFGGTRTCHRMKCAVEDAGFEIRDTIIWIYGSGFPKSHAFAWETVDKYGGKRLKPEFEGLGWGGWGTALKPAVELIVKARKPISEKNVAMNVLAHGVGGINVDGCRIGNEMILSRGGSDMFSPAKGWHDHNMKEVNQLHQGRFPANIILECTCEKVIPGKVGDVDSGLHYAKSRFGFGDNPPSGRESVAYNDTAPIHTNPNCPAYMLDEQSGETAKGHVPKVGQAASKGIFGEYAVQQQEERYYEKGGASRFFYVAKASKRERWFYCHVCEKAYPGDKRDDHAKHSMKCLDCGVDYEPKFQVQEMMAVVGKVRRNQQVMQTYGDYCIRDDDHKSHNTKSNLLFHVTQKPVQLIRYLIRLVTPKGGTVLDPFVGSGTTLEAARWEGVNAFGIEIGNEYEPLINARLSSLPKSLFDFEDGD